MEWVLPGNELVSKAEVIGEGNSRITFAVLNEPSLVIKENKKPGNLQNYSELRYWQACRQGSLAEFLCPIVNYTEDFKYLLMKRTTPITDEDMGGVRNVFFKSELDKCDWGLLDGKVVCHDYSHDFEYSDNFSFLELDSREEYLLRMFFKKELNIDMDVLLETGFHPGAGNLSYIYEFSSNDIYITDGGEMFEKTEIKIDAVKWLLKFIV